MHSADKTLFNLNKISEWDAGLLGRLSRSAVTVHTTAAVAPARNWKFGVLVGWTYLEDKEIAGTLGTQISIIALLKKSVGHLQYAV